MEAEAGRGEITGRRVRYRWVLAAVAVMLVGVVGFTLLLRAREASRAEAVLEASLAQRQPVVGERVECPTQGYVHLLVLGQSNAGNHGQLSPAHRHEPVPVAGPEGCSLERDPLPGATGRGASVWSRLPAALGAEGVQRPVLFSVLAVDATSIDQWTDPQSPLAAELRGLLRRLASRSQWPNAVLWQQGEADARRATSRADYEAGLRRLVAIVREEGLRSPILLAVSTRCRSEPYTAVAQAIDAVVGTEPGVLAGPDTDPLDGPVMRHDGCHFSAAGLDAASRLWAKSLAPVLATSWPRH